MNTFELLDEACARAIAGGIPEDTLAAYDLDPAEVQRWSIINARETIESVFGPDTSGEEDLEAILMSMIATGIHQGLVTGIELERSR